MRGGLLEPCVPALSRYANPLQRLALTGIRVVYALTSIGLPNRLP